MYSDNALAGHPINYSYFHLALFSSSSDPGIVYQQIKLDWMDGNRLREEVDIFLEIKIEKVISDEQLHTN